MYSKILITGELEVVTGLHIGAGGDYAAIGAADSPVTRDEVTGLPMIPASSLKGKLRSLLAKKYNKSFADNHDNDAPEIISLFGGMKSPSRLIFSDMFLSNMNELKEKNVYTATEIKFENTINRMTAVANPRQIERVIRQSKFKVDIIYNVVDDNQITSDICLLADGIKLLEYDYLGGHGSRGYGRVKISNLSAECVIGNDNGELDNILDECNNALREVDTDEI